MVTESQLEFPREVRCSRRGGTDDGYAVEVRLTHGAPKQIGGILIDSQWRQVPFAKGPAGVPTSSPYSILPIVGLMNYQAAQALRWWLHAGAEAEHLLGDLCIETRLVQYEIKLDYETRAVSAHDHIGGESNNNRGPSLPPPTEQQA